MSAHQNRLRNILLFILLFSILQFAQLESILSHLLYPDHPHASLNTSSHSTTTYSQNITQKYHQITQHGNFFYDGLVSTVISQLSLFHDNNNIDASEMKIIDIACGNGGVSRLLSDTFNYKKIVGVDISESQIALAKRETNSKLYPNIEYNCFDGSLYNTVETFDIGVALWFYNYAKTENELYKYIQSTYNMLKPNGIIVGVTNSIRDMKQCKNGYFQNNPQLGQFFKFDTVKKHNFAIQTKSLTFHAHIYDYATYKSLFTKAGFKKIEFLNSKQYKTGANSTEYENKLFIQFYDEKYMEYNVCHVFVAQK